MSTDGYLTIAHFICEIGYSLNGSTNLSCLTNHTWDQNEPNCCKYNHWDRERERETERERVRVRGNRCN